MTDRESEAEEEDDDDEDVVPLDFRTALIEAENKVVIQAKPLALKTDDELLREAALLPSQVEESKTGEFESIESYLEAVKKEPFSQEEANVILIEPDINIKAKFDAIELACNKEQRINNTFNAPIRTPEQMEKFNAILMRERQRERETKMQAPKIASKQYDTDTDNGGGDGNTDTEQPIVNPLTIDPANPLNLPADSMPHGYNRSNLDFKNILKQFGVSSLNKFMGDGMTSESEPDSAPPQQQQQQQQQQPTQ